MASLIVGQGRSTGWVGVAPEARILPVAYTHSSTGPEELAESIRYVVDHGAKVVNMSIGANYDGHKWPEDPPCPPVVEEALDRWKAAQAQQQRALYAKPPGAPSGGGSSGGIVSSLVDAVEDMGLRGTSGLLIVGSGVVLLIVVGAVAVALVVSRRRGSPGQPGG